MNPLDVENTVFPTQGGNFHYTVMPFGLENAGASYQQAITSISMMIS